MNKKAIAITIFAIAILIAIAMTQVSAESNGISGRSQSGCRGGGCHFDNTFTPDVEVRIENLPSEYTPNTQYTITVKVVNGPSGNDGGFDLSVDKGTLSVPNGAEDVQIDNGAIHTSDGTNQRQWNVVWTSPSANSGDVTFYVAGSSVNGDRGTTGDGQALNSTTKNEEDSQLPTITITSPLNNSILNTTLINVQGTANDNIALQKVEISKDNTNWVLASGKENWQGNLTLDVGINTIYAKATDTSNNYNITSIIVNVSADTLGTLKGYVYYEKYGEYIPIENASVLINGATYYTDIVGFFKINLQEGEYTLFFSKTDFYTNSTQITIVKNTTLWIYSLLENIEPNNVSINVVEKTFNSINISWNEVVENAFANYTIFISDDGNLGNLLNVITSKNETNYNISGLDENIVYYITVRVYDNYTKFNDTTIAVKTLNDYPEKIELSVYGTTENSINLIWQKSRENDFARYTIFISEINGTLGNILISLDNKSTESYNAINLKADTLYYFTLRVYDIYGLFTDSTQYHVRTSAIPTPTHNLELINGGVSPLNGDTETLFRFSVVYKNSDNNKPTKIQVIIDDVFYNMEEVDGEDKNYKDGKEYFYETTLKQGIHNYTFYATDGKLNFTSQKGILRVDEKKKETARGFLRFVEFAFLIALILVVAVVLRRNYRNLY